MNFLRRFRQKKNSVQPTGPDYEDTLLAIEVFEQHPYARWDEIQEKLVERLNRFELAHDFFRLLPLAYVRYLMVDVKFSDIYFQTQPDGTLKELKLSENPQYVAISGHVKKRFAGKTKHEQVLSVLNHSQEFSAINQALEAGSRLEDLILGPPIFT